MWPQSEERLYFAIDGLVNIYGNNGDVKWRGGPDGLVVFSKRSDGSYISPHGYRATLSLVTEAGSQVFKLVRHDSGPTASTTRATSATSPTATAMPSPSATPATPSSASWPR